MELRDERKTERERRNREALTKKESETGITQPQYKQQVKFSKAKQATNPDLDRKSKESKKKRKKKSSETPLN